MKTINNELIRSFKPCYDPSEKDIPDNETLEVKEWVEKYRDIVPVKDILWLLLRNEFYDDKQLRIFAVWCARKALKLSRNPDKRSVNACDVAERYANGDATKQELDLERDAARSAALDATAWDALHAARWAAINTAKAVASEDQLNYLLTL